MKRYIEIFVPCLCCGGEGGHVGELLDEAPANLPVVRPGDEMPVLTYNQSRFVIEVES